MTSYSYGISPQGGLWTSIQVSDELLDEYFGGDGSDRATYALAFLKGVEEKLDGRLTVHVLSERLFGLRVGDSNTHRALACNGYIRLDRLCCHEKLDNREFWYADPSSIDAAAEFIREALDS